MLFSAVQKRGPWGRPNILEFILLVSWQGRSSRGTPLGQSGCGIPHMYYDVINLDLDIDWMVFVISAIGIIEDEL